MKNINYIEYRFDLRSAYLMPLLALAISTIIIFSIVVLSGFPIVEKTLKNASAEKVSNSNSAYILNI
jgi:hypothetical protein